MANETGADASYGMFPFKDVPRKCLQTLNIILGTFRAMQTSFFKLTINSFNPHACLRSTKYVSGRCASRICVRVPNTGP